MGLYEDFRAAAAALSASSFAIMDASVMPAISIRTGLARDGVCGIAVGALHAGMETASGMSMSWQGKLWRALRARGVPWGGVKSPPKTLLCLRNFRLFRKDYEYVIKRRDACGARRHTTDAVREAQLCCDGTRTWTHRDLLRDRDGHKCADARMY